MIDSSVKSISFQECLIPRKTESSTSTSRNEFSVDNCKHRLICSFSLVRLSHGEEVQGLSLFKFKSKPLS